MQKARRFVCSTASQSSPSNTTIRTRKKSRTSSAGGDSLSVSRVAGEAFESKSGRRSTKCNVSLLSNGLKNSRKAPKSCRAPKRNVGNLQNAVVLAPFYTLKRCFQNKLVDLYSNEKMKKMNKAKVAKKQNMSFEYDIIEMKPLESRVKKEAKVTKKPKQKSRSASYCQCKKSPSKNDRTLGEYFSKNGRKVGGRELSSSKAPGFSGEIKTKRRKLNPGVVTPTSPKSEIVPRQDLYAPPERFPLSDVHPSSSVLSSPSWETYSNAPSCKEKILQGSLAISTTSFDSHLENFDKVSWDYSDTGRKFGGRSRKRADQEVVDADFLANPTARHLLAHVDRKNSDGEIVDFMDREPQTQVISALESDQHWQPLRRQSRTKRKKPENESAAGYYLRSLSCSKEQDSVQDSRTFLPARRQEDRPATHGKTKVPQVEVGTQMDDEGSDVQEPGSSSSRNGLQLTDVYRADVPREETSQELPRASKHSRAASPPEPAGDGEPSVENLPLPRADPEEGQSEYFGREPSEAALSVLGERSDLAPLEVAAGFPERFQGPSDARQPQDKESHYIFGSRNSASGLGESCEFSFGLKWVFSDDED